MQLVALVEDQARVVELPTSTEVEPSVRVGVAGAVPEYTGRTADPLADVPKAFVQLSVYVCVPAAVGVSTRLPLAACVPLQLTETPLPLPDAVQLVASIDVHVSVAVEPSSIDGTDSDRVGTTSAVSAWMNPYPELKFGVEVLIGNALERSDE